MGQITHGSSNGGSNYLRENLHSSSIPEPRKKTALLSAIESWLVNRDPYFMEFYDNPYMGVSENRGTPKSSIFPL